jgi:hypothetical protein
MNIYTRQNYFGHTLTENRIYADPRRPVCADVRVLKTHGKRGKIMSCRFRVLEQLNCMYLVGYLHVFGSRSAYRN